VYNEGIATLLVWSATISLSTRDHFRLEVKRNAHSRESVSHSAPPLVLIEINGLTEERKNDEQQMTFFISQTVLSCGSPAWPLPFSLKVNVSCTATTRSGLVKCKNYSCHQLFNDLRETNRWEGPHKRFRRITKRKQYFEPKRDLLKMSVTSVFTRQPSFEHLCAVMLPWPFWYEKQHSFEVACHHHIAIYT
jgi:hypothetical protein